MKKVKFIKGTSIRKIENEVNNFLEKHSELNILEIRFNEINSYTIVMIYYEV